MERKLLKELIDDVRPLANPYSRAGKQSVLVKALIDRLDALGTPFDSLMGQIAAMKSRSERYEREAKGQDQIDEAEKHARVSSVLRELERLGREFEART